MASFLDSFKEVPRGSSDIICTITSASLRIGAPPFAGDTRAFLLLLYMLILAEEADKDVENAAVIVLEAFVPWKDFLEGWRNVGLRT